MEFVDIVIGTMTMIALVFIPGLALSLAVFPKKDELDLIERIGFSFVLGLIPQLLQYLLDKNFSVPITTTTTYGLIALTTALGLIVWKMRVKEISK